MLQEEEFMDHEPLSIGIDDFEMLITEGYHLIW